ncbi:MAG: hypothetical protein RRA15_02910 [bacterium]|nr:hypothetical protein [bacterium]MDT8365425.1 hypothetical protein [bacterium]
MDFFKTEILIILAFLMASLPVPAAAYELDLKSSTYLHLYQVDQLSGPDADYAPLYEHLSLDLWEVGRPELSFHLYGWGSTDLGEESASDTGKGHLSSAQVRYRSNNGDWQLRVGRMLLTEGTTLEALDGLHYRQSLWNIGFSLFGGNPNEGDGSEGSRGETIAGARGFFIFPGKMEIGLNYLTEDGDYGGDEREEAGTDLWLKPSDSLEITGHALYNLSTSGMASDDLSILISLSPSLDVVIASQGYIYENLFQTVTNPAFLSSNINLADEVRITRGEINWSPAGQLDLHGAIKNTDHSEAAPGDNTRTEIGLDLDTAVFLDRIGVRFASQTGDLPENEYNEMRAYCMASMGSFRWSLDAFALTYEEKISGEDQTTRLVGSAGWKMTDNLDLSGDLRMTKSPVFDEDLAVVLRARYDFGTGSGAK